MHEELQSSVRVPLYGPASLKAYYFGAPVVVTGRVAGAGGWVSVPIPAGRVRVSVTRHGVHGDQVLVEIGPGPESHGPSMGPYARAGWRLGLLVAGLMRSARECVKAWRCLS